MAPPRRVGEGGSDRPKASRPPISPHDPGPPPGSLFEHWQMADGRTGDEAPMVFEGKSSASFTGGSGQMAVMGELLHRKCNAAIPHVDVGTDVFAFRDDREEVARIQVKTAQGVPYKKGNGYHAQFNVPMDQLRRTDAPPLFYALAVRREHGWGHFIVISRSKLHDLWNEGCGSVDKNENLRLNIRFRPDEKAAEAGREESKNEQELRAPCGMVDLTDYINTWENLPPLKPPVPISGDAEAGAAEDGETAAGADVSAAQTKDIGPETPQT
jgi:hypothetical protein